MRIERPCEAPIHSPHCNGRGETEDHFTPKCIARKLGWSKKQINAPENIQFLSHACHDRKDRSTPRRLQQVIDQLHGKVFKLGDHNKQPVVILLRYNNARRQTHFYVCEMRVLVDVITTPLCELEQHLITNQECEPYKKLLQKNICESGQFLLLLRNASRNFGYYTPPLRVSIRVITLCLCELMRWLLHELHANHSRYYYLSIL